MNCDSAGGLVLPTMPVCGARVTACVRYTTDITVLTTRARISSPSTSVSIARYPPLLLADQLMKR